VRIKDREYKIASWALPNTSRGNEQKGGAVFTGVCVVLEPQQCYTKKQKTSSTLVYFISIMVSGELAGGSNRRQCPRQENRSRVPSSSACA
jgi:hypothetical protein